ncbi:MAG: hypothetical protein JSR82_24095 [Verrucomicrobia bacterium]|nr:hypothetical protein [Verrucomicrobiota bacterium]
MDAPAPFRKSIALTLPPTTGLLRAGWGPFRKCAGALAAAGLLLAGSFQPAQATTVPETTFSALVAEADQVVLADVLSTRADWTGEGARRRIATFVRIRVVEALKGGASGEFELDFTGGTVGQETLRISGMPQLRPGAREIFFLRENGRSVCPLLGFWHGRFKVWRGAEAKDDRVCRHDGRPLMTLSEAGRSRVTDAPAPSPQLSVQAGMTVPEFLAAVRTEITRQQEGR